MIGTSLQHLQIAVYFCALVIGTCSIAGRIWARHITRKTWQANDYLMFLSYMIVVVMIGTSLAAVFHGELGVHGKDMEEEAEEAAEIYVEKVNTITSSLMFAASTLIKLSILEFYTQLFPQEWLRRVCYAQMAMLVAFMVAQIIADQTMCLPSQLDPNKPNECRDEGKFWLAISILAAFFGFICVVTPMPLVWQLHLSTKKKIRVMVLFGLGFFICGLTIVRTYIYQVIDYRDSTWGFAHCQIVTVIEPTLGILAGSIPILATLFSQRTRHLATSTGAAVTGPSITGKASGTLDPFSRLDDNTYSLTDVKSGHDWRRRGSSTEGLTEGAGAGGIKIQSDIVVDIDEGFKQHS
ncbi:hypothetical protein BDV95DRAFT_612785 [Massariosphaeria phaeospora]|uniref:Rhodopsin domain-containing protein n=1 Tax=Massariosphaeria phaeospora TaxID=100035 RepID=A0A7C8M707_9PLEO|nr:hypothetical protein BDV95DRAFT_612785 [Massariosphaeria phaeospora]